MEELLRPCCAQVEGPYKTQLDHYTPSSPFVIMIAGGVGVSLANLAGLMCNV